LINKSGWLLLSSTLALFTASAQTVYAASTGLDLPEPNGCYSVGTKTIVLVDAHRRRELVVMMWYPAKDSGAAYAPYMDKTTADAIAQEWQLEPGFERQVHTHSRAAAPIAAGGPFPLVLLEHGSGVVPSIYTVLAESLASSGFIVVAPNHTPDSLISVFPDGHEVRFKPYWPEKADHRTQGVAIGKFAEDVLVPDVRFVLDRLAEMGWQDDFWRGHLDLSRVGIVGHSMGGTTAALAARSDPRILAGVNLDGSTYPGMNADVRPVELHKPFLFVMTEEHASNPATQVREYVGSKSNTYYVVVSGADHMSFTDSHLVTSRFEREVKPGIPFESALLTAVATRCLVEEFLGKYLEGKTAPSLDLDIRIQKQ
jgi:predicted dienelactone hydrolase